MDSVGPKMSERNDKLSDLMSDAEVSVTSRPSSYRKVALSLRLFVYQFGPSKGSIKT